MNLKNTIKLVLGAGLLTFSVSSCDIFDPYDPGNGGGNGGGGGRGGCDTVINLPEQIVESEGTVRFVTNIEGSGFWAIDGVDGRKFEPINLPEAFMQEGMKVKFKAQVLQNWASFNYYGEVVELLEIQAI